MTLYYRGAEKRRSLDEMSVENEEFMDSCSSVNATPSKQPMDSEKRIRREIANSNERRRMQTINVGFQCLKALLPQHNGEKLSKAAILQHTGDYVKTLEKEKTQLLIQNAQLRQKLKEVCPHELAGISPPPKRKKRDTESSDEGIGMGFDDPTSDLLELRKQLDRERQQRIYLEQRMHNLENQLDPEKAKSRVAVQLSNHLKSKQENEVIVKQDPGECKLAAEVEVTHKPQSQQKCTAAVARSAPVDVPPRTQPRNPPAKGSSEFTSPQSKRNLEMIAEAIRHLEGDNMFPDTFTTVANNGMELVRRNIPHSEESQTESSNSDQEDCKYDSSGCDSPLSLSAPDTVNVGLTRATATLCVTTANSQQVVTPLPITEMHLVGSSLFRPAVIVPSSS